MIRVNASEKIKDVHNFWNNFHFHPTDAIEDDWGKRILDEARKDNVAGTVRFYAMLEDIVSMDASGKLHYDFSLNDERIDYMLRKGYDILLSYNFMPPCIAEDPNQQNACAKNKTRYKGKMIVNSKLRDAALWEEICYEYTKHIVERYGKKEVERWYLQCYNEPDIGAFFMYGYGTGEEGAHDRAPEYLKLYRGFESAIRRVDDNLHIGGPALAGSHTFLRIFLDTVKSEGLKLDFISLHDYGTSLSLLKSGAQPFCVDNIFDKIDGYLSVINECGFGDTEIVIDEWGASSQGFLNIEECPALMFREGSEFAAYFGKMITGIHRRGYPIKKMLICLSGQHEMTVDFSGFRNFFTLNFIKKPIYNAYILARKLLSREVFSETDRDDLTVLATGDGDHLAILLSYAEKNFKGTNPSLSDVLTVEGIRGKCHVRVTLIDETHTNPYKLSLLEGFSDHPNDGQIATLRKEGTLRPAAEYDAVATEDGKLAVELTFSDNALALVEIIPENIKQ